MSPACIERFSWLRFWFHRDFYSSHAGFSVVFGHPQCRNPQQRSFEECLCVSNTRLLQSRFYYYWLSQRQFGRSLWHSTTTPRAQAPTATPRLLGRVRVDCSKTLPTARRP